MDQELDRTLNHWDAQSCGEFEQFLDDMELEDTADADPPCECYYVDADVVESRFCSAHNPRLRVLP